MAADKKLTKKQLKALAFRSGTKGKAVTAAPAAALPEASDDEEQQEVQRPAKRKRGDDLNGIGKQSGEAKEAGDEAEGEEKEDFVVGAAAKRRRRKKASQARAAAAATEDGENGKTEGKGKSRLIVFVGNLPFDVSAEQIADFFAQCGERPQVRLLTTKAGQIAPKGPRQRSDGKKGGESKGCAFVEFFQAAALQKALRLHHSPFPGPSTSTSTEGKTIKSRKINVELSAGGGGRSVLRQEKLSKAKERLDKQRGKRAEKEVREEAVKKALASGGEGKGDKTETPAEGKNRKRKRGQEKSVEAPAKKEKKVRKFTSGANATPLG